MTLRIATRRSALARAQAHQVGQLLAERTGEPFELVPMASTGDLHPDRAVGTFDVKGMFVDTIRDAVRSGDCHVAVHSAKDLPSEPDPDLAILAHPPRHDPRDVLITRDGWALQTLPATATVGTSSERRRLQLLRAKPGLQVLPLRGNLDTRLRRCAEGELDAVVVALAGLQRLYTAPERGGVGPLELPLTAAPLEPGECVPAPAQGALALEARADDARTRKLLEAVDHLPTRRAVEAERSYLRTLGAGCLAAVGALCNLDGMGGLELLGMLGDSGRRRMVRRSLRAGFDQAEELGRRLAEDVQVALDGPPA